MLAARLGKTDLAMQSLDKALALGSDNARVFAARGRLFAGQGDTEKALADLNQALALQPNDAATLLVRDRLTEKTALVVPLLPSASETSLIARLGWGSSLVIVPVPTAGKGAYGRRTTVRTRQLPRPGRGGSPPGGGRCHTRDQCLGVLGAAVDK